MSTCDFAIPVFEQTLVENIKDGYWLDTIDINADGRPDLVASGLELGQVVWYENPGWHKHLITTLPEPVAWDYADIDGDGMIDIVISHNFGGCPRNCKPEDGKISWLRNPGRGRAGELWDAYFVANLMATHRVKIGHFTQNKYMEILGIPVVGPGSVHTPCPLVLYPTPGDVYRTHGWDGTTVDDTHFGVLHDATVGKFGAKSGSDLDSLLVCSNVGITWFYYRDGAWQREQIGSGELKLIAGIFKGTGNVAVAKIGNDPFAAIMALEPFHGNTVALYTKDITASLTTMTWKRSIVDVFGQPNELGEGSGHHVVAADFDGDGDDEFLVGLRGPAPWQGVFYYKAINIQKNQFVRTRVSSASTSMIAVADFDGDGRLDFATTGYHTPGFFLADDPQLLVFSNKFGRVPSARDNGQ
jgi:hypothetical protein